MTIPKDSIPVHMTHCNMGEEFGHCKYGNDGECPALADDSPLVEIRHKIKANWIHAVCFEDFTGGFYDYAEEYGDKYWAPFLAEYYKKLDEERDN